MSSPWKAALGQAVAVIAAGCVVGVLSNVSAGPARRLEWVADYPAKKVKDCRLEPPVAEAVPSASPVTSPSGSLGPGEAAPVAAAPDIPAESLPDPSLGAPYVELSSAEALRAFNDRAVFLDARMTNQHAEGHVAGAHSFGVWEAGLDEKIAGLPFLVEGDLTRLIVIYCNGGDCEDSHTLSEKLRAAGYERTYVYKDGFPDWLDKGRPVTKGSTP